MRTILRASLFVLVAWLLGCAEPKPEVVQAESHLAALRNAGLVPKALGDVEVAAVRRIQPLPTRWVRSGRPFWWAELRCDDGSAGHLAWMDDGRLIDFSLEGLSAVISPQSFALAGVPPIQQFPLKAPDGSPVASGCVPTAGASPATRDVVSSSADQRNNFFRPSIITAWRNDVIWLARPKISGPVHDVPRSLTS